MDLAKTTARGDKKHLSFDFGATYTRGFTVGPDASRPCRPTAITGAKRTWYLVIEKRSIEDQTSTVDEI